MFYNAAARRRGVPVRIGHSHNTAYEPNFVGKLDKLMSARFNRDLTDRFACSRKAGEMLFGASPFTVLPNGVDTGAFARHDPEARARLREHLGVAENEILLGHVGRFSAQKNHAGLLRIFAAALQRRPNAGCCCWGRGRWRRRPRALAQELGVADRVIFAGCAHQCAGVLPRDGRLFAASLFEGLPVVLVEAQAARLPLLCFGYDRPRRRFRRRGTFSAAGRHGRLGGRAGRGRTWPATRPPGTRRWPPGSTCTQAQASCRNSTCAAGRR